MRKIFSLVLVCALVLTTMALPVMAEDLTPQTATLTVSFVADETEVKPGETVTVDLMAAASADGAVVRAATIDMAYPTGFEVVADSNTVTNTGDATYNSTTIKLGNKTVMRYIYSGDTGITLGTTAIKLASVQFKVLGTATVGTNTFSMNSATATYYSADGTGTVSKYTVGSESEGVTVSANGSSITIDGAEYTENYTYVNATGVNVVLSGSIENATSVTLNTTEILEDGVIDTDALTGLTDGTYTLVVAFPDAASSKTYTFNVSTEVVNAQVALDAPDVTVYTPGETVTVDVNVSGLDEEKVGMLSFDITYDSAKLSITETDADGVKVTKTEEGKATFVYGSATNAVGKAEGIMGSLTFTVLEPATYGKANVTISNQQLALEYDETIVGTNATSTISLATVDVTVVPADGEWATVDTSAREDWSAGGEDYYISVGSIAGGAEVKYVATTATITDESAANHWADASELTDGDSDDAADDVLINSNNTYYVIAKVEDVYKVVATLVNGTNIFWDAEDPVLDVSAANWAEGAWKSAATEEVVVATSAITVDDAFDVTYTYQVNGTGEAMAFDKETGITIPAGSGDISKITVMATDLAGNVSTADITVYIDSTNPTVELTQAAQVGETVTLTVNASDALSQIDNTKTKLYRSATKLETETIANIIALSGVAPTDNTYPTNESGFWYVVAYDNAGNASFDVEEVTVVGSVTVPGIKVKTVNAEDATVGAAFKTTDELSTQIGVDTNGTFTYVAITVDDDAEGFVTTATLVNGEDTVDGLTATAAGDYTLTLSTVSEDQANIKKDVTYKFTIVDEQANMVSTDGDAEYDIVDFSMIKNVLQQTGGGLSTIVSGNGFMSYLAGDLDGDLDMDATDAAAIITAIENGMSSGYYQFNILNNLKWSESGN